MLETSVSLRQSGALGTIDTNSISNSRKGHVAGFSGDLELEVLSSIDALELEWAALETQGTTAVYQSFGWVKTALETLDKDLQRVIVTARTSDKLHMILPMVLKDGLVKHLRWVGGSHANIGGGIYSKEFLQNADRELMERIVHHIRKNVSGITLLRLGNQKHELDGYRNPLSLLQNQRSVNAMFIMDLANGFDAMLEDGNAKRKRRNFRKQCRLAEEAGGFELVEVDSDPKAIDAIKEFRAFKEVRFRQMGIEDVFASEKAKAFLEQLATYKGKPGSHLFKIYQLKIGGKTRAMYAGGLSDGYFQAAVNAISIDELTHSSPGEMLLYLMVEKLVGEGVTKLDLGVGHERYKRSWCQQELELFDTLLPLSPIAAPIVWSARMKIAVKGYVRSNPVMWQAIKKLRRLKAPTS